MLPPKTMRPECCGMLVEASCWSIDVVWSPINKPSRATCQPSMDVTVAYCSFTQRHILLLPNEFSCCPSHMCLLHMVSLEVCGNVGQEIGNGFEEYTGIYRYDPMIPSVRWEMKSIRSFSQTGNMFHEPSMSHHEGPCPTETVLGIRSFRWHVMVCLCES